MPREQDPLELRRRLQRARVLLLFTPAACAERDPFTVLDAVLEQVDIVQVRPKAAGAATPCAARETYDWTVRVLELVHARKSLEVLVMVDDRVDVAAALRSAGCCGVHIGTDDMPVALAREYLGPTPLIGSSTHSFDDVAAAEDEDCDYIGFGPLHPTSTKGYTAGLGAEAAWIAHTASSKPVFPIGGIGLENAHELSRVGRAAVASAILSAPDPARAACELRAILCAEHAD
ncbi:MAG: thiamine phosphate synthase [Planctomycetes bacterium]|nr:thiamine phosphate synthase [Planctomycetota bacterium]